MWVQWACPYLTTFPNFAQSLDTDGNVPHTDGMPLTAANAIFGHTDEDSALVVDDYPYGYRLRTQIRYWIETTKNGDRFVSQTLNPKTGRWNKPKKSTYCEAMVLFREDDTGHISHAGLSMHAKPEWVAEFVTITEGKLSDAQKLKVARVIGVNKAFEGVTFKVEAVTGQKTAEERQAEEAEQAKIHQEIARRASRATREALGGLS